MEKKLLFAAALLMSISLVGCSAKDTNNATSTDTNSTNTSSVSQTTTNSTQEDSSVVDSDSASNTSNESSSDEVDMNTALFRSTAYVIENEITTGLTTEYLANECNFPVTVVQNGKETVLNNQADLDKMGLDALYTEDLVNAVKNADIDNLEVENDKAILGDVNTAYVVINKDENDNIGIKEFHYQK